MRVCIAMVMWRVIFAHRVGPFRRATVVAAMLTIVGAQPRVSLGGARRQAATA